ncbi:hypothetical protein HDU76_006905 [Blyttiomyces sp. JEL0837]|nr:hypothetical protein HDU76_006905 [Blyttiomyces sp. JEL0837]
MNMAFTQVAGSSTLTIHNFADTGRGLQTTKPITKSSEVLCAPSDILWSVDAAHQEPILGPILRSLNPQLPTDDTLAIYLLFVKHSPKCTQNKNSLRRQHLKLIPETYTSSILFEDSELDICEGSSLHQVTIQVKQQIEDDHRSLVAGLYLMHPDVFPLTRFTVDEYTWALLTVWSRAMDFQVPTVGEDGITTTKHLRCIVPFVDLLNHSNEVGQCHLYETSSGCVKVIAGKDYKEGDQVFINYGPVSNTRLLRLYGFTIPNNPNDTYTLYLSTHPLAPQFQKKLELLQSHSLTTDSINASASFEMSQSNPLPPSILKYLRIQRLDDHEVAVVLINKAILEQKDVKVSARNEYEVLQALLEAFTGILSNFKFSLDLLESRFPKNEFEVGSNSWNATVVAISEQRILKAAKEEVERRLALVVCAGCGSVGEGYKMCSRCLKVVYCDVACQKKHFKVHKVDCVAPAAK